MSSATATAKGTRRKDPRESRFPPAIAVVVAIAIYALLPGRLVLGPRLVIPAIEVALLIAVVVINPTRMTRDDRWARPASIGLDLVVIAANLTALVLLLLTVTGSSSKDAESLLLGGIQVWATNVIGFGLLYWEVDAGGSVQRFETARDQQQPDLQFPQDTGDAARQGWKPVFVDYLYVSLTNSSAFSPTDTMPMSHRAKGLFALQATVALVTSLIVIARAINSLG